MTIWMFDEEKFQRAWAAHERLLPAAPGERSKLRATFIRFLRSPEAEALVFKHAAPAAPAPKIKRVTDVPAEAPAPPTPAPVPRVPPLSTDDEEQDAHDG